MAPRRSWVLALNVWPGLPQIWTGQEILGLLLASGFAVALNLAILGRYVWTELLDPAWTRFFAASALATWALGFGFTAWWNWRCHPSRHRPDIDRLYREATGHYLGGRWEQSRRLLEQILTLDDQDADALMQLGSLYLRTGRTDLARQAFRQCLDLEAGGKWRWEIERAWTLARERAIRTAEASEGEAAAAAEGLH